MIVCEINSYNDGMYDIMNPLRMDVVPVVKREGGIHETPKSVVDAAFYKVKNILILMKISASS